MNDDKVGLKRQRCLVFGLLNVGAMAFTEQRCARVSEVFHFVVCAQKLLQHVGVTGRFAVGEAIAKGYTVAHASHFNWFFGSAKESDEQ